MPFHSYGGVRFYSFDMLDEAGVTNAVFTRQGGLSPEPWASLNVGGLIGDEPQRVYENRVISFEALGRAPTSVYDVWQVHSAEVICTDAPRPANIAHKKADAILTDRPEVTLFMRFADCVPILFYDPVRQVAGVAHAGWRGTVDGIASRTVETMVEAYGCKSTHILAAIGPSIGAHHYEVGPEVAEQVQQSFGTASADLLIAENGAVHFDLWSANRLQLGHMGVRQIEMADICTACRLEDWYSHRGEQGKTGRFGALIALKAA